MQTTPSSTLKVGDLQLRPIRDADAAPLHGILSDPRVYGPTSYDVLSLDETRSLIIDWLANEEAGRARFWAVTQAEDDLLIGRCGFHRIDPKHKVAELGYKSPLHRGTAVLRPPPSLRWWPGPSARRPFTGSRRSCGSTTSHRSGCWRSARFGVRAISASTGYPGASLATSTCTHCCGPMPARGRLTPPLKPTGCGGRTRRRASRIRSKPHDKSKPGVDRRHFALRQGP